MSLCDVLRARWRREGNAKTPIQRTVQGRELAAREIARGEIAVEVQTFEPSAAGEPARRLLVVAEDAAGGLAAAWIAYGEVAAGEAAAGEAAAGKAAAGKAAARNAAAGEELVVRRGRPAPDGWSPAVAHLLSIC